MSQLPPSHDYCSSSILNSYNKQQNKVPNNPTTTTTTKTTRERTKKAHSIKDPIQQQTTITFFRNVIVFSSCT